MRVLLADDHLLIVEGLTALLTANGFDVVGVAGNGREAVELALALTPDVVLMDLRMPVLDGLAATRLLQAQRPEIQIVVLTTSGEDEDLFEAVRSGACGYILKSTSGKALIEALHALAEGGAPFSPGLAGRLLQEFARLPAGKDAAGTGRREAAGCGDAAGSPDPRPHGAAAPAPDLTERQTQVLRLVASGLTYRQAGDRLGLAERTVRYHMLEIMARLHLEHRNQVIAYAGRMGLRSAE